MTTNATAQSAISTSIRENRIVTLTYAALDSSYIPVRDALSAESEDGVVNGDVHEFWGTDDDGDEWRVHLVQPR